MLRMTGCGRLWRGAVVGVCAVLGAAAPAGAAGPVTQTFAPGASEYWIVPSGVTSVDVVAIGSNGRSSQSSVAGGKGARVTGTLTVVPGTALMVNVATIPTGTVPGANGGGSVGGAGDCASKSGPGGGASDIRTGDFGAADRVIVAGGGGGGGTVSNNTNGGQGGKGGDAVVASGSTAAADGNATGKGLKGAPGNDGTGGAGGGGPHSGGSGSATGGGSGGIETGGGGCGGGGGGGWGGGGGGGGGDNLGGGGGGGGGDSLVPAGGTSELVTAGTTPTVTITYTPVPPAHVAVSLDPSTVPADPDLGAIVSARAVVTSATGGVFNGNDVSISAASSDPGQVVSDVASVSDGTDFWFEASVTPSRTLGTSTITFTATGLGGEVVTGTATLTQVRPPPSTMTLLLSSPSIAADGASTTTAVVALDDHFGVPVTGEPLTVTSSDAGQVVGPVVDRGDGTYAVTITSSRTVGDATITAKDGDLTRTRTLTQTTPPPPAAPPAPQPQVQQTVTVQSTTPPPTTCPAGSTGVPPFCVRTVAEPAAAVRCVVPDVKGKSLTAARKALTAAHCAAGKVTRPKRVPKGAKLVVSKQTKAGSKLADGAKVPLTLRAKPKR